VLQASPEDGAELRLLLPQQVTPAGLASMLLGTSMALMLCDFRLEVEDDLPVGPTCKWWERWECTAKAGAFGSFPVSDPCHVIKNGKSVASCVEGWQICKCIRKNGKRNGWQIVKYPADKKRGGNAPASVSGSFTKDFMSINYHNISPILLT
jgi:hypothetical protein